MLVTMKRLLDEARDKNYAVGAFDAMDRVTTEAILNAAEETRTPVILMVVPPCVNPTIIESTVLHGDGGQGF